MQAISARYFLDNFDLFLDNAKNEKITIRDENGYEVVMLSPSEYNIMAGNLEN